jgi:aldose sugar dehydrogenase
VTRPARWLPLAVGVAVALSASVPPASAAPSATRVVDCRPSNAQCWPTAFAFVPSGNVLFYVERFTGQIRRVNLSTGADSLWHRIPNVGQGSEQGLLGLALDPGWARGAGEHWVYAFYTNAAAGQNQIVRLRKGSHGVDRELLVGIELDPPRENHNGGVIHFGPDRKLYAVTGDQGLDPGRSQDLADDAGKVLRLNQDGSRPADNPIPNSNAYSFGHRNSFGLGFDPLSGRLWQTENGPQCDDEINLIRAGGNYGWGPQSSCPDTSESGPPPHIQPKKKYTPTIVPTGLSFCVGCGLGRRLRGDLLFAAHGPNQIRHFNLNQARNDLRDQRVLYTHPNGVLALERRLGGALYFSDLTGIFRLRR